MTIRLTATIRMSVPSEKDGITPAVFARRAAGYFRACDNGTASAACDACDTAFGDAKCSGCRKKQTKPYTLSGLCLALGIPKRTFKSLRENKEFAQAVEMALLKIEAYIEENSISGHIGGTLALAILRENFGWGEKTEAAGPVEVMLSEEAKRYGK